MRAWPAELAGVVVFEPSPVSDDRGSFSRTFDAATVSAAGLDPAAFVQDSQSRSHRGVVRGLHMRRGRGEAKVVRCSYGAVYDVAVDLRPGSSTFGRWAAFDLDDITHRSVYLPPGLAHGFQALTEPADVHYRIDAEHDPAYDVTIAHDDPELAVTWPLPVTRLSERDRRAPRLAELRDAGAFG